MGRLMTILLIGSTVALAACAGNRGVQRQSNLTPAQQGRVAEVVKLYGLPRGLVLLSAASRHLAQQNYGNAIQAATLAIESGGLTNRGKSLGYSIRAAAYARTSRLNLARADTDEALRADPRNIMALNAKGAEALLVRNFATAGRFFSQSIAIRPTSQAHLGRAFVRILQRQLPGALSDVNQSIAIYPELAAAYTLRGMIQHAMGRKDAARRDFQEALRRDPRDRVAEAGLRAIRAGRAPQDMPRYRRGAPGSRERSI
jgi:tetratricopeptide (TPR) repeat protein